MGRNNYFQFKKFKIIQEKSAMKVNTDGILLGTWVNTFGVKAALDIGTGTGLIALMLAQRSTAKITGIEIEENAAREARLNVANSPWQGRISIYNSSFQEFAKNTKEKFDLIVSNPPFFANNKKPTVKTRKIARHNDLLPFTELISYSTNLLNEKGRISVIVPFQSAPKISKLATDEGFFLIRNTDVKSNPETPAIRCLMEFRRKKAIPEKNCFSIFKSHSEYSEDFKKLTKEFYLNF